jgi:hypothetical protein
VSPLPNTNARTTTSRAEPCAPAVGLLYATRVRGCANLQAARPIDAPPERTHTDKRASLGIRSNSHRVHIYHPRPICAASLTLSQASVNAEPSQSVARTGDVWVMIER